MIRCAALLFAWLPVAGAALAQGMSLPAYERVELDNGTVLIVSEKHDVPLIALQAVMRGGAVTDPQGLDGLSSLVAELLEKGAGSRDAAAFAEAVAAVGGRLSAGANLESTSVSGEFLSRDAGLMIELIADMLRRPALDAGEFARLRDRSVNLRRLARDGDLYGLLPEYGAAFLFGNHVYGRPVDGSEASLGRIRHEDVRRHYQQHFGADRLILSVVGDFDTGSMVAALTQAFGDWERSGTPAEAVPIPDPEPGPRVLLVDKPGAAQTYFWIGAPGVSIGYARRAALNLANTLFGGRYTSMLNQALRADAGLTYDARSVLTRPSQPGTVAITSFTATDTTAEAVDLALEVLATLHREPVPADVLDSARNYMLGQFPTALETAPQLAGILAQLEQYGLGRGYVDDYAGALVHVDAAALGAVIAEVYPAAADLVFVLLGDAEKIRDAAERYGPVTAIPISAPEFRP